MSDTASFLLGLLPIIQKSAKRSFLLLTSHGSYSFHSFNVCFDLIDLIRLILVCVYLLCHLNKMNISYTGALIGSALAFKVLKACWDFFNTANDINEVIFSNSRSACCTDKRNSNCTSTYCMAKHIGRIVEIINAAQQSISLYMYMFTLKELSVAIIRAHERGVYVRVIAEQSMAYSSGSQMRYLSDAGKFLECSYKVLTDLKKTF